MRRALHLGVLLMAVAGLASADAAIQSATLCAGGGHEVSVVLATITREVRDGAMTSGSANLDSATAAWVAGDVGKTVSVIGAGTSGRVLVATISSRTSATRVVLASNAATTVSAKSVYVLGATRTIGIGEQDTDDDVIALRAWERRQLSLGKTRAQLVGQKVVVDAQ